MGLCLQSMESAYLTQPLESRERFRTFFASSRPLLSFLSHKVALATIEGETSPNGASLLPEHLLVQLDHEMTQQAPTGQPMLFFREHAELPRWLVDATMGAARRAFRKAD